MFSSRCVLVFLTFFALAYIPSFTQAQIPTSSLNAAKITINGTVKDENGQALQGVTVHAIGTNQTTQTDVAGSYTLDSVAANGIMVFRMVGRKNVEEMVDGRTTIDILMVDQDVRVVDEVVVVGYGTVLKKNLTGAVSSLKGSAFQQQAITNAEEGIAGKIAGVRVSQQSGLPGSPMNVKIRGLNSITASSTPLYVIDGLPQQHMRNVNPRDIESMEVLKDASSASIYGARGGNGVIVITTKSGQAGRVNMELNTYMGFQEVERKLPMMNRDQYLNFVRFVRDARFLLSGGDLSAPMNTRPANLQYPDTYHNSSLFPDNNWQDLVYRRAPMQNYDLRISGGGDVGTFNISGGFMRQDGVMQHTGFERYNLRANTLFQFSEKFNVGANIAFAYTRQSAPQADGKESNAHYAVVMPPIVEIDENTQNTGYSQAQTYINPLVRLREMTATGKGNNVHLNTFAEYLPIATLKLRTQLGYNFHNATYNEFIPFNVNGGAQAQGRASNTNSFNMSIQNTVTYIPSLGDNHDLEMMVGQSFERNNEERIDAGATGYPNDLLPWMNNASTPTLASSNAGINSIASFFGRVQYNFLDRYLVTASARYDGSSRFGANHKWGLFPAISAGWKINEESFMQHAENISLFKLRASWGLAGNDRIPDFDHIALLGIQNYNLNGTVFNGLVPSTTPNNDLTWEKTRSIDIGLDLFMYNDRLQLTVDAYDNRTSGLLLSVPTTRLTGFATIRKNLGVVQNKGLEFQLTSHNIQRESFQWMTSLNFSINRNKVLNMGGASDIVVNTWGADAFVTREGYPIGSFYMYETDGLLMPEHFDANGNPLVPIAAGQMEGNIRIVDQDENGIINADDYTILGSNQPNFLYGISSNIYYKGFDFSFDLQGSQGGMIFYQGRRGFDNGLSEGSNQYVRWLYAYKTEEMMVAIPDGADMLWDGKTPNMAGLNPVYNDTWLYNASFLRIRNVTLGYELQGTLLERLRMNRARFYVMADNLHTFTKYPGANPEANNTDGNESTAAGIDYGSYPISRRFTLGVQLTF